MAESVHGIYPVRNLHVGVTLMTEHRVLGPFNSFLKMKIMETSNYIPDNGQISSSRNVNLVTV